MTRTRLILGAATATATAAVLLLGGIFHDSSAATPSRRLAPGGVDRRRSRRASRRAATARPPPSSKLQAKLAGQSERRDLARRTRPRVPAAGARDRRSGLLHEVGGGAEPGAPARAARPDRHERPRDRSRSPATASPRRSSLGRKAHAISPTTALNYGITGDALVELGRYPAAFEAFDTMATLKPSLSSYARVSHGARAARPRAGGDRDDEARRRGRAGPGRAGGLDAVPARQALLVDRPRRGRRAARPRRPQSLSRLPLRARRARADRGGEGAQPRRDRARAAGRRHDPAAAVRGAARRPLSRRTASREARTSSTR